jgi:hypothetical protein
MWLPKNDPWRRHGDLFNGKYELEGPPPKRSSVEIDILLKDWKNCPPPGKIIKKRKRGEKKNKAEVEPLMWVYGKRDPCFGTCRTGRSSVCLIALMSCTLIRLKRIYNF